MARNSFDKFINQGVTGAKKKEQIRQEKKQARVEKNAYFDQVKQERKAQREVQQQSPLRENQARSAEERTGKPGNIKPGRGNAGGYGAKKAGYNKSAGRPAEGYGAKQAGYNKTESKASEGYNAKKASYPKSENRSEGYGNKKAPYHKEPGFKKESRVDGAFGKKPSYTKPEDRVDGAFGNKKTYAKPGLKKEERKGGYAGKPKPAKLNIALTGAATPIIPASSKNIPKEVAIPAKAEAYKDGVMPLNKFIAHAGVCSRRDAADLVKTGTVVVNGKVIIEPGFKVTIKDEIKVNGKQIVATRNHVYILLNKPKDFLTTTEDPEGRKTVMDIIRTATTERVYPIGRLDRNTTGVLLLTNDGELAQKLSHPSYEVKKIYEVRLDKPLQKKDFDRIAAGVELEDGMVAPDVLAYADSKDKSIIGIEIHSGKNRIVRRIFEHVGYDVRNLDRVMYANLTKKNVERGKWRFLSEKEVRLLKFLNASYTKKPDHKPVR